MRATISDTVIISICIYKCFCHTCILQRLYSTLVSCPVSFLGIAVMHDLVGSWYAPVYLLTCWYQYAHWVMPQPCKEKTKPLVIYSLPCRLYMRGNPFSSRHLFPLFPLRGRNRKHQNPFSQR